MRMEGMRKPTGVRGNHPCRRPIQWQSSILQARGSRSIAECRKPDSALVLGRVVLRTGGLLHVRAHCYLGTTRYLLIAQNLLYRK
jgi:hypothetical protein